MKGRDIAVLMLLCCGPVIAKPHSESKLKTERSLIENLLEILKTEDDLNQERSIGVQRINRRQQDDAACGGEPLELTASEGTIQFPASQSEDYANNLFCQWRITLQQGERVRLRFDSFDVEQSEMCQYDELIVYDGPDYESEVVASACGSEAPADFDSTGNQILVTFYSDDSATGRGFVFRYKVRPSRQANTEENAGLQEESSSSQGQVTCGRPQVELAGTSSRIVGGEEATPHSWPWQVRLSMGCGGTVVSRRWILTAAHCFEDENGNPTVQPETVQIQIGIHKLFGDTSPYAQTVGLERLVMHEQYNQGVQWDNDIALVYVDTPIEYNAGVQPICLPRRDIGVGQLCTITGWGETQNTGSILVLNQLKVPTFSHEDCMEPGAFEPSQISGNMLCAGYLTGGKDSCKGDSGGPMVCRANNKYTQYGIISWGTYPCALRQKPGIYTRLARYTDWIIEKTDGQIHQA